MKQNNKKNKMKVIGLTGGIGSGKSTFLEMLREQGCYTVQLDQVAHQLMQPEGPCYLPVVQLFGPAVLSADTGEIQRKKLADIVFHEEEKRQQLNRIVHPEVKKWIVRKIEEERQAGQYSVFVMEAALLIEDHYDEICDELWYIYADEEIRIRRLMKSRGYSEEKARAMMASQLSDKEYRCHCQRVIDNSKELCYTDLRFL